MTRKYFAFCAKSYNGLGNELLIQKFEIAHAGVQMGDARTGGTGASFRG